MNDFKYMVKMANEIKRRKENKIEIAATRAATKATKESEPKAAPKATKEPKAAPKATKEPKAAPKSKKNCVVGKEHSTDKPKGSKNAKEHMAYLRSLQRPICAEKE